MLSAEEKDFEAAGHKAPSSSYSAAAEVAVAGNTAADNIAADSIVVAVVVALEPFGHLVGGLCCWTLQRDRSC